MASKNGHQNFTIDEIREKLSQAIDLTKLFPGFKVPEWIFTGIGEAVEQVRNGKDADAVATLLRTERGVYNVLASFFRNSAAKFFPNKIDIMEEDGVSEDIRQRCQKKVRELEEYASRTENLDLTEAAKLYNETLEMFKWGHEEYDGRLKKRRENEEEERQRQAEAQRALEQKRREEKAASLEKFAEQLRESGQ